MRTLESSNPSEEVAYWITQRDFARKAREAKHYKGPRCADEIINRYRFCNVHREDDKVTKWLSHNWRPYWRDKNFVAATLLARMVNWPPTLLKIGYPAVWDSIKIIDAIHAAENRGKAWSSAYVITTCGQRIDKALYVVGTVCQAALAPVYLPQPSDTLGRFWTRLRRIQGLGAGFLAAQVVADLKYTPLLAEAEDWWTFAVPGPGSRRGINRYFGYPLEKRLPDKAWKEHLDEMIKDVEPLLPQFFERLHAQDWQNVMCEYDKWCRAKNGEGRPRQRYTPSDAYKIQAA